MTTIETTDLPSDLVKRLLRYPATPAARIGQLAVDTRYHGQGFGTILLLDELRRAWESSEYVVAYAVVVDAINERARHFYEHRDFRVLTADGRRLFLPMQTIAELFR